MKKSIVTALDDVETALVNYANERFAIDPSPTR